MSHDVFISYSVKDKNVADAVCANLEAGGIRCWIAPRDVRPGGTWAEEIVQAIGASRALVLIFSSHSDNSEMVNRELDIATDHRLAIIPFRIEDITPSGQTRFYLAGKHWLDAMTPPLERHLASLVAAVKPLLNLLGPQEERGREEGGVGQAEPQSPAAAYAKSNERRFRIKKWHYVAGLAVLGFIIVLLVGKPQIQIGGPEALVILGLIIILLVVLRLIRNTGRNALPDLKKAAAAQVRSQKGDKKPGAQPQ